MKIANDITELTGNTPLVRLNHLVEEGQAEIAVKLEYLNPSYSVKDRIGVAMINAAEESGQIHKNSIILEATSGHTGIGLGFLPVRYPDLNHNKLPDMIEQQI